MTTDLERALGGLAAAAESAAHPVPVERLLTRVHRRRAARTAVTSAAGITTAGAVALGAMTIAQSPRTAPPVTAPSTSPSPDPSAGPTSPTLSVVTAGGPFACDTQVPEVLDPPGDGDLHFEPRGDSQPMESLGSARADWADLTGMTMVEGEYLLVDAVLVNGTAEDLTLGNRPYTSSSVALAQNGVVVGYVPLSMPAVGFGDEGEPLTEIDLAAGTRWSVQTVAEPQPCASSEQFLGPERLSPGEYDVFLDLTLYAGLEFYRYTPEHDAAGVRVVGGPYPITVLDDGVPEPTAPPPLEEHVLTVGGLGDPSQWPLLPFRIPVPSNPGPADLIRWDGVACDGAGRWVAAYPDASRLDGSASPPFTVQVADDVVMRISLLTAGPRTMAGIQVGATLAELQSAHPDARLYRTAAETGGVEAWVLQHNDVLMVFEIAAADGSALSGAAAGADRLVSISVLIEGRYDQALFDDAVCA